jgi:hypothetical protein
MSMTQAESALYLTESMVSGTADLPTPPSVAAPQNGTAFYDTPEFEGWFYIVLLEDGGPEGTLTVLNQLARVLPANDDPDSADRRRGIEDVTLALYEAQLETEAFQRDE